MVPVVYLHGFASGPTSRKARFFESKMEAEGLKVSIPSLEGTSFEHMTITSQLELVREATPGECILIGSSMGGYLAALRASEWPMVRAVVMMAPAFFFPGRWEENVGLEVAATWRQTGRREVFHHSRQRMEWIGYGLLEDARQYDSAPRFEAPGLILHGQADNVVPVEFSRRYVAGSPHVDLREYEAGHELTEVMPDLWNMVRSFLTAHRLLT